MRRDPRIVFMGTPEFAAHSLRRLRDEGWRVVGVVTMPDKPVGRHHDTLQASPVKRLALELGIPVLQPEKLRDEAFLERLRALRADLQVVVAFRMLPRAVWEMPPLGTFNLHAALLPQYRGAAPINWAIIRGERETGLTTFFLDDHIDTGSVIMQEPVAIGPDDYLDTVHDRMMEAGACLVARTVEAVARGEARATPQAALGAAGGELRDAPKIFKETCQIHWSRMSLKESYDFVRGLSPVPAPWTTLRLPGGRELTLKVCRARPAYGEGRDESGPRLRLDGGGRMSVAFPEGSLELTEVQPAGKRRMSAADFLRGTDARGAEIVEK